MVMFRMIQGLAVVLLMLTAACAASISTNTPENTPQGDASRGDVLFHNGANDAPACGTCHQTVEGASGYSIGPNLNHIGMRAGNRIEGMDAPAYIKDSILHPSHYVVRGYFNGMYNAYAQKFSEQDVNDLVAYLLTL